MVTDIHTKKERSLSSPIQYLRGVGPKIAGLLNNLGIKTIEDIIYYFPRYYEDRTNFMPIAKLQETQTYAIKAEVLASAERRSFRRGNFKIVEVVVGDQTAKLFCVWFNQPYLKQYFKVGESLILYGKVERYIDRLQMNSPEFEIICAGSDESLNMGRIVPVYSLSQMISQRKFREIIKSALDEYLPKISDFLPYDVRLRNNLLNLAKSLINIHFPDNLDIHRQAYERLSFEEFFLFQLPLALRKLTKKKKQGIVHNINSDLVNSFIKGLPFKLTLSQQRVIEEIRADMGKAQVMQRLLEGDVGSGKTIVATSVSLFAIQGGYQVAFMVPTEILARQHYEKIRSQLSAISEQGEEIHYALLTSSMNNKEKQDKYQDIKEGKIDLVIGTHALLEEEVRFKNLGLVVIDEQHKFGVGQRALLPQKGVNPDVLIMTATPIPRTLAITLYGDLDISVINELPPQRAHVKTIYLSQEQENKAYDMVREEVILGHQAYIIYPVIDESCVLDIAGAKKMYELIKKEEFSEFKVALIHGRLKQKEQDEIMLKFRNKELDILVATTVLEVGIDVPAATCMIIQNAERFGLSQLHQLRGRIGRGLSESFCILISGVQSEQASRRIEAMIKYSDGFSIAEEDMRIRGPGQFFGKRQHGLSELKIANPLTQMQILKRAREEAIRLINMDSHLQARQNALLSKKLLQRFPEYENLMLVG